MPEIAIGLASVLISTYNLKRRTISFDNLGPTNIRIVNLDEKGLTLQNASWRLTPGQTIDFSELVDGDDIHEPWSAIGDAAGGTLIVGETFRYGS